MTGPCPDAHTDTDEVTPRLGANPAQPGRPRRRHPYNWLTDKLPTWLLTAPFEVGMLLIAALRSALFLAHVTPAMTAEQSLPKPMLFVLLGFYGVAAVFTLVHLARGNLALERAGLLIVGPFAFAYAITLLAAEPNKQGIYSFAMYMIIAGSCLLRSLTIRKVIRVQTAHLQSRR